MFVKDAMHTGLLMAGGRSLRMGVAEKAMLKIGGKYMVEHVLERLTFLNSLKKLICVVSPYTPMTKKLAIDLGYEVIETEGHGYYEDLKSVIENLGSGLYATFSADVPFIEIDTADSLLVRHTSGDLEKFSYVVVVVREELARSLGLNLENTTKYVVNGEKFLPTGMRMIRIKPKSSIKEVLLDPVYVTVEEAGFAINVNTSGDLKVAEQLVSSLGILRKKIVDNRRSKSYGEEDSRRTRTYSQVY